MARPGKIKKDDILKAASSLITETGGLHFTMDLVAAKAGISKGGLTYSYPTKDSLIEDMLRRELERFVSLRKSETKGNAPLDRLEAHIKVSAKQKAVYLTRAAHLMAALSSHPDHRKLVQAFYREAFELADPATEEGRRTRKAFLSIEGLFLLRGLGLMQVSDQEWNDVFADALADLKQATTHPMR